MKVPPLLTLAMMLLTGAGLVRANSDKPEGPPSSNSATDEDPVPAETTCPEQCDEDPPDPVVVAGGKFYYPATDVRIRGRGRATGLELKFFRSYSSQDGSGGGVLGTGWATNLVEVSLMVTQQDATFRDETGALVHFWREYYEVGDPRRTALVQYGDWIGPDGWTLTGTFLMKRKFGRTYSFSDTGKLLYIEDPAGNRNTYTRDALTGRVTQITDASNRSLTFGYNAAGRLASVTDPLGRVWIYGYTNDDLTSVTYPLGYTEVYTYDLAHNIIDIQDRRGNHTSYAYNESDQVIQHTRSDGAIIQFTYNNFLGTSSMTDEAGKVWSYEYLQVGLVSNIIDPENNVRQYSYNSANERIESRDPLYAQNPLRKITYTWNANHDLTAITGPDGAPKTFTYSDHMIMSETHNGHTVTLTRDPQRRVTSVTDARNKTASYTYDAVIGLLQTITDRRGKVTTLGYDTHGNLTSATNALGKTSTFTYDAVGRRLTATDPLNHTTTYTWDNLNRVTRVTYHNGTHSDYTYDANGNLLTARDPLNHGWTYTYDARNRRVTATDQLNHTTTYGYDGRSLLTSVTDPLNRTTTFGYDGARRRTSVTQPAPVTGGQPLVTTFVYNPAGELTSLTDAKGQTTQFSWDPVARIGVTTFPGGSTERSDYDAGGNVTAFKNRNNSTLTYTYDENDRLTAQNCPTCGASFAYDDEGNLTQTIDAGAGTYSWTHDDLGRVLTSTQPGGAAGGAKTVTYAYDDAGRRATLTYPDSTALSYGYDVLNRLTSITQGTATYGFAYDDASRRTQLTFPGGVSGAYGYDTGDRLLSLNWTAGNSNGYGYDNADNITSYSESHGSVSGSRSFGYDRLDRLVSTSASGSVFYGYRNYGLDAVGNRTSVSQYGGGTTSYTLKPGGLNQYATAGGATMTYDSNGNLLTDGTRTLTYDADNHLTQATKGASTVNYLYDWAHRLAQRTESGTTPSNIRHIYDGNWNVLSDVDATTGATLKNYVHGPAIDEVLAQITPGGSSYYLTKNHLGSTTALINTSNNTVAQRFSYDEYGAAQVRDASGYTSSAPPATRYLYTGREYDTATGLYNYRHRFYNPTLGRFVQPDPIGFRGGINLYRYVANNPTRYTDPDGTIPVDTIWDVCNLIYDAATGNWDDFASDAAATMIPYVPAGASKLCKAAKRYSKEKEALVDMAKVDKKTGMTEDDMEAYKELNKQLDDPFPIDKVRGPESHPNAKQPSSQNPHGHVGPVDHIPIE